MTQEKRETIELLLANRLYLYTLLHSVFGREPDAGMAGMLCSESAARAFGLLSEGEGSVLDRAAPFLASIADRKDDPDWLDTVRSEYTRLFIGPGQLPAPPWESVYLGEEPILFQSVTLQVRETYRSFGLLPEGYPRVADDSLALELGFMEKLAGRALEDWNAGDMTGLDRLLESAGAFLEEHLLRWIPKFLNRMKTSETQILYPQLCLILDAFLRRDLETVRELRGAVAAN